MLAEDDQGTFNNIEMQCYELTIDSLIRTQLYGSKILRPQLKKGENYNQKVRKNIYCYIQKEFQEDISCWLQLLNEEQLF